MSEIGTGISIGTRGHFERRLHPAEILLAAQPHDA
jgi:hypothetical protein